MRVLGPGWHLLETIGTSVHKAALMSDRINHGMSEWAALRVCVTAVAAGWWSART